ncbi:MAG: hypothetical protein KDB08_01010 [Microthrixaceae bacterium]|nr:hypothetical protein [Microthrixaceae bacterium]
MQPESIPILGVALALASAVVLSVGNILQSRGVRTMTAGAMPKGVVAQFWHLVRNRFWLIGGLLLGLSILFQLASLTFAPLMVVQPIGVTALVFTVLITSVAAKQKPAAAVVRAITICVLGVASFVTVAAIVSTQHAITGQQLGAVLVVLVAVLLSTAAIFLLSRRRTVPAIMWVVLGGVYSGFVVTLGKTVILRVQAILTSGAFTLDLANVLTILCVLGIAVAGGLSIYFVQLAHASNRAEVVVAGLTVIDPAVAVIFSITILAEASNAPPIAMIAFIIAGAVAVLGVFALSRAEADVPEGTASQGPAA